MAFLLRMATLVHKAVKNTHFFSATRTVPQCHCARMKRGDAAVPNALLPVWIEKQPDGVVCWQIRPWLFDHGDRVQETCGPLQPFCTITPWRDLELTLLPRLPRPHIGEHVTAGKTLSRQHVESTLAPHAI